MALLIPGKFRPLDTDMEGAHGLENKNGVSERSEPDHALTHTDA